MKESSLAEKIVVGLTMVLISIMGFVAAMVIHMNSEFGVIMYHIENHPNLAIERDVDELERRFNEHGIGHPR